MKPTGLRRHAALCVAAGAPLIAAVAIAPTAYAYEDWGAIAVSPDGKYVGTSWNQPNEYQANRTANFNCHQNNPTCNVLITFKAPQCGAVVKNGNQYFGDTGATKEEAEKNAMNQSPGSTVLRSQCNVPPPRAPS